MSSHSFARHPFQLLVAAYLISGSLLMAVSWQAFPPPSELGLVLLVLAALASENYAIAIPGYSLSLAYPLSVASTILYGPTAGAVVAAVTAANAEDFRTKLPASVMLFNLGQLLVSTVISGWVYVLMGGRVLLSGTGVEPLRAADFPVFLFAFIGLAIVGTLGNVFLTGLGYSLKHGARLREALSQVGWLPPAHLALACLGFVIAEVVAASPAALPLFVFPLVLARQFHQRSVGLRDAYGKTIGSLIGALEAKDMYTRGHSERVAKYATGLGWHIGLDSRQIGELQSAALLHDIGKLEIDSDVLRKCGSLTAEEFAQVRKHPAAGADMIQSIPVLSSLADVVRSHHERIDGSGYPLGLGDADIPRLAKILAISDAYDAMTSSRAYRQALSPEEAISELRRCSGSQFDPALVDAFLALHVEPAEADPGAVGRDAAPEYA